MEWLPLRERHLQRGALFDVEECHGWIRSFGDVEQEYRTLTQQAGWMDLCHRGRLCVLGHDRLPFLHGQVTNDVQGLKVDTGCYAALVNAKGKMQSDLNVYRLEEEILLDFESGFSERVQQRFESHIVAEEVEIVDIRPHYGLLSLQGPSASTTLRTCFPNMSLPKDLRQVAKWESDPFGEVVVIRHPRAGLPDGYDCFVPLEHLGSFAQALDDSAQPADWCGEEALDWIRIENSIPRFGVDMDETTLPPEAGLEPTAISYSKGCYIGQEVIARIRTYGQVARKLMGILIDPCEQLPRPGAEIIEEEKEIGRLTSAVQSPCFGKTIAMGYVKRKWAQAKQPVVIQQDGQSWKATLHDLPFSNTFTP